MILLQTADNYPNSLQKLPSPRIRERSLSRHEGFFAKGSWRSGASLRAFKKYH